MQVCKILNQTLDQTGWALARPHLEKLHTAFDRIRYLLLPKEDAILMERLLLTAHKQVNGELPPFNKRPGW